MKKIQINKESLLKFYYKYQYFIKYSIIGVIGVLIDFVVFFLLHNYIGLDKNIATTISTSCGIINNFILNVFFNFKTKDQILFRFLNFYFVGIIGILITYIIFFIFVDIFQFDTNLIKLSSIFFVAITQFYLNKKFSFQSGELLSIVLFKKLIKYISRNRLEIFLLIIIYLLFLISIPQLFFTDEIDNILGGKLILEGALPYRDFFSHHMPLQYFISAFIYSFSFENLLIFKFILINLIFSFNVYIYYLIKKYTNTMIGIVFCFLAVLTQYHTYSNFMLAETFISYSLVTLTILFIFRYTDTSRKIKSLDVMYFTFWISLIVFSALAYIPLAALLVFMFLLLLGYQERESKISIQIVKMSKFVLIILFPFIIFLLYILVTGSTNEFIFQNYVFNSKYYSQFTDSIGGSLLSIVLNIIKSFIEISIATFTGFFKNFSLLKIFPFATLLVIFNTLVLFLTKKRYFIAVLIIFLVIFTNPRIGGIGSTLGGNFHGTPFHFIVFFFTTLLIHNVIQFNSKTFSIKKEHIISALIIIIYLLSIIIPSTASNLKRIYNFKSEVRSGEFTFTRTSDFVNSITESNDYVWIGPFDFKSQLFLEAKSPTKYTFFLPWHNVCEECTSNIINDFENNKPKVIVWDIEQNIWGYKNEDFGEVILNYLEENYFQIENDEPEFRNYFFLRDDSENLCIKLNNLGKVSNSCYK